MNDAIYLAISAFAGLVIGWVVGYQTGAAREMTRQLAISDSQLDQLFVRLAELEMNNRKLQEMIDDIKASRDAV